MHPMIPAEYISNIIYEGPGADSLFFASGQLRELAYSVETTAESLEDELDELDENWKGSSSDLLADAVERYLQWLTKHSRQILETAYVIDFLAYVYEETRHKVIDPGGQRYLSPPLPTRCRIGMRPLLRQHMRQYHQISFPAIEHRHRVRHGLGSA
ncbi:hypothetical protein BA04_02555 [Mycobacterium tuberculosis NRITLD45]|nr:hypothetical protein BA04_02555 [Mycobacterium tuberculosis NRITLD45]